MSLRSEIKKAGAFDCLEQEAALNVHRTDDFLAAAMAAVFKPFNLSGPQYNVLRILRGAGAAGAPCPRGRNGDADPAAGGLACGEIADRMIARDPDMTRLLDRLETRGLVSRCRGQKDRRVVAARITDAGLKLLKQLDPLVTAAHKQQLGHLSRAKLKQLIELLEEARERKAD